MYTGSHGRELHDRPALVMAGSGASLTYGQLERRANQIAHLLRGRGLRQGDHIAVLMPNSLEMLEIQSGAERSGVYYTLVNSHLTADEVAYVIDNCQARLVFSSAELRDVVQAVVAACPRVESFVMAGTGQQSGSWESYESALDGLPVTPIPDEQLGAAMLYSSGTTGRPKGVLRPLPDLHPSSTLPALGMVSRLLGFRPGLTYLNPAPLYHAAPQASVAATVRLGGTAVVMERFDPEQWCALVERFGVTHTQVVPTMLGRLLRLPESVRRGYDISSLEVVVHSAAPCPIPVKEAAIEWLGPIVREYYAATEAHGITYCDSAEWSAHPGTVGRAIVGTIEIRDDDGSICPTGVDGTIWFRGATGFAYFGDGEKTAAAQSADGEASTVGDIGHVDEEGYLYLTDRKSHMIISGGVNIYPQETENLLAVHPAVADVAVIGVPNADSGEEVKAVVELVDSAQAGPDVEAELIAFCRSKLASIKCPRSVDFTTTLPRLPNGKLYKHALREGYWKGRSSKLV